VRDTGLIFLASGAAQMRGARKGREVAVLAAAGRIVSRLQIDRTCFPVDPATAATQAVNIVFVAALGAALAWSRMKRRSETLRRYFPVIFIVTAADLGIMILINGLGMN